MADRTRMGTFTTLLACAVLIGPGVAHAGAQEEPSTPCNLLTRSEIKRVFKSKTLKGLSNGPTCTWEIKGESAKRSGADLEVTAAGAAAVNCEARR